MHYASSAHAQLARPWHLSSRASRDSFRSFVAPVCTARQAYRIARRCFRYGYESARLSHEFTRDRPPAAAPASARTRLTMATPPK